MRIKIAIVEDHELVREGLRLGLEKEPDFQLIGEASDGHAAISLAAKLKPDVLLLDLSLPKMHGLDVIRQVTEDTKTKIIVVSMHSDEPYVIESFRSGASGYVLKESTRADLATAIRLVVAGKRYVSSTIDPNILKSRELTAASKKDPFATLTKRERLVLQLAAEGKSSAEIAKKMFISPRTAETHRANLMRKLHLRSQTDLVRLAIRKNIISA